MMHQRQGSSVYFMYQNHLLPAAREYRYPLRHPSRFPEIPGSTKRSDIASCHGLCACLTEQYYVAVCASLFNRWLWTVLNYGSGPFFFLKKPFSFFLVAINFIVHLRVASKGINVLLLLLLLLLLKTLASPYWHMFRTFKLFVYYIIYCMSLVNFRDANKCLEGTHVVFLGDSRIRYLYHALIHVLNSTKDNALGPQLHHYDKRRRIPCGMVLKRQKHNDPFII